MITVHIERPLWELPAGDKQAWVQWLTGIEVHPVDVVCPSVLEVAGCTVTYVHMERTHEGAQLGPVRRTRVCAGLVDRPPAGFRMEED